MSILWSKIPIFERSLHRNIFVKEITEAALSRKTNVYGTLVGGAESETQVGAIHSLQIECRILVGEENGRADSDIRLQTAERHYAVRHEAIASGKHKGPGYQRAGAVNAKMASKIKVWYAPGAG